jgi:hypothetical protein
MVIRYSNEIKKNEEINNIGRAVEEKNKKKPGGGNENRNKK